MDRCKTCKHWKQTGYGGMEQGECKKSDFRYPHANFAAMSRTEGTMADAYRLDLYILTQPFFGCVLHEPREQ